jgi:Ca2+-transporting ATPase
MSSVREVDGKLYLFVKGAPESILAACTMYRDGTRNLMLTAKARAFFVAYNEEHAALAQRNLAYAYRALPRGFDPTRDHLEVAEQN